MQRGRGRGCGCGLAVLIAILAVVAAFYFWRSRREPQLPPPSGGELQVRVLDVGQGDAILIRTPSGKVVLVDAGVPGSGKTVLDALRRVGAPQVDLLVATHAHADHIGGADEVIRAIKVLRVLDSKVPNATKNYEDFLTAIDETQAQYVGAQPGQSFDLGDGARLTVLAPYEPFFTKEQLRSGGNEPNANSVVTRLDYGNFSMLLTGDAEAQTEERIMTNGGDVRATVLKVGHHGSRYATSENFLNTGQFKEAVISASVDNRYGHPSQQVLDRLRAAGVKIYRTDLQGEITIVTGGSGYAIKPSRTAPDNELWAGRTPERDDSARSGFVAFGEFGPPKKQKAKTPAKKVTSDK